MSEPKKRGRQPDANSKSGKIRELLASGMATSEIAKNVGCTPALVYNVKARMSGIAKKRGPGRPARTGSSPPAKVDGIAGILQAVQNSDRERAALRSALEKIQAVIASALT